MSRLLSQVLRRLLGLAHSAVSIALGIAIVITASTGVLVWRLAEGPIDLAWLAPRIDAFLNTDSANRLHIDSVALAWEGWRGGVDRPVDLQLRGITATGSSGMVLAKVPQVELSLSFGWLLLGRLVPRAIEVDQANIELIRTANGALSLGVGDRPVLAEPERPKVYVPFPEVLRDLVQSRPRDRTSLDSARPRWSELRRIRIKRANVVLVDQGLNAVWRSPETSVDLHRLREGDVDGTADITMMVANRSVRFQIAGRLRTNQRANLRVRFGPLELEAVARAIPILKPLGFVHGAALGTATFGFGPGLDWQECTIQAQLGQGTVQLGEGSVPILGAILELIISPRQADLRSLRVTLDGPSGTAPVMSLHGKADRRGQEVIGSLQGDLDKVEMSDLGRFWPTGLANGARKWVIRNVTAGKARAAHVELSFQSADDGSDAVITNATGKVSADDLTIHWLRPLPPVEHVGAELTVVSPDSLVIKADSGRLAGASWASIFLRSASIKVTGMMEKDQFGAIEVDLSSSLPDALSLLREPRLHLLDRHPIELRRPSGQDTARIALNLWLDDRVTFDSIPIHAAAELHSVHLADVLRGQDLSDGEMSLNINNDGMQLEGTGAIAGTPTNIGVQMDFRAGPPSQIRGRYEISGSVHAGELGVLGVEPGEAVRGPVSVEATVLEKRDGTGEADVQADLRQAELSAAPLGWLKRVGQPAAAKAHVVLDHDRIVGIDRLALNGEALSIEAAVQFIDNRPELLRLSRAILGNTSGSGEIRFATTPGYPIRVKLEGTSLDLTGSFNQATAADHHDSSMRLSWLADLKFDRVVLGPGRALSDVAAEIRDDGAVVRQARITGHLGDAGQFALSVTPEASGSRRMVMESSNAGGMLRALNIASGMDGGQLVLAARTDDGRAGNPLFGTAEITSFRLREAPAATRVLEAMTLYGLAAALRGPGLEISRLVAPFRITGSMLELNDARAFSPSLGFTAKGRIDLQQRTAEIDGTIVPAYFFNSLLGRIPVLGNLFSPEKGGGMFAATYKIRGQLSSPTVSVNPLAALTPGFLRGLFGIFRTGVKRNPGDPP